MAALIQCTYCGSKWDEKDFDTKTREEPSCPKCGQKDLQILSANHPKIDYYQGCPPFKDEDKKETKAAEEVEAIEESSDFADYESNWSQKYW